MSITLAEVRGRVRMLLEDAGESTLWSDSDIDAGIRQSIDRYAFQFPRQDRIEVPVTQGDTIIELPADALQVRRVADHRGSVIPERTEPIRHTAADELAWEQWAGEVEFTRPLAAGSYRIWYTATIGFPESDEEPIPVSKHDASLLVLGAASWCLEQRAVAEWKRGELPARYETVLRRTRDEYAAAWRARLRLVRTGRLTAAG